MTSDPGGAAPPDPVLERKRDACLTYIEQTKLLVSLASVFVLAPGGLLALDATARAAIKDSLWFLLVSQGLFVSSVVLGYLTLGALAGSQDRGEYDVYRPATRNLSLASLITYLIGLGVFVVLVAVAIGK
jgi:hypothetical protein